MNEEYKSSQYTVPLAIVVAGALIAGAIYFGDSKQLATNNQQPTTNAKVEVAPITERDHVLGSRSAEIMVVEYSDTECPFCKTFHTTMKEIVRIYGGKVAWVYRHFPIASLHSRALKESEATECTWELGGNQAFWNYTDKIFEVTNSNNSLDPIELPKIAASLGLDVDAFNNCLSSGKYAGFINESVEEAIKAGARGTPYSVIIAKGGKKSIINGAEPIENVQEKIDTLLK